MNRSMVRLGRLLAVHDYCGQIWARIIDVYAVGCTYVVTACGGIVCSSARPILIILFVCA